MKKKMHARTMAIVLATTTMLQLTGTASKLVNGEAFVKANALVDYSNETGLIINQVQVTTSGSATVYNAELPVSVTIKQGKDDQGGFLLGTVTDANGQDVTEDSNIQYEWFLGKESLGDEDNEIGLLDDDEGKTFTLVATINEVEYKESITIPLKLIPLTPSKPVTEPQTIPLIPLTPAKQMMTAVRISGSERTGETLKAELMNGDVLGDRKLDVKYEWYRLEDKDDSIEEGKLVGTDETYELSGSDINHYIKLVVRFNGKVFYDMTSDIASKSPSSSSTRSKSKDEDSNKSGIMLEKKSDGTKKLTENGQLVSGWQQVNGSWYLGDSNGTVQIGWKQVNEDWYLLEKDGSMTTGWQQTDGYWYLLKNNGAMATGWQQVNGNWYLLKANGAMATGWQNANGKWYYLNSDGSMAANTVIDGYRLDASGEWVK